MRILQIIYSLSDECGGPVVNVKRLSKALAGNGCKVSVCGTMDGIKKMQEKSMHGYNLYEFPVQKPHRYFYSPQLESFLQKNANKYDVFHIHGIWTYPTYAASRISRRNNIPYIMRPCGMLSSWNMSQKWMKKIIYFYLVEKYNLKKASYIQFSTEIEFEKAFYRKWDRGYLRYIPNIVETDEYDKFDTQIDDRLSDKKYILFFGRLCYQKGLDILIEAYDLLQKNPAYKDVYLVLMGPDSGSYLEALKKKIPHTELWDKIINTGMIYGAKRFAIVKNALFLCLPSRQENLGLAILEAFACGIPVIVSISVDIAPLIEKEYLGRACPLNSIHLSSAMREMIDSYDERIKMGVNAINFIKKRFNRDIILKPYISMYEEAISKRNFKAHV